MKRDGRISLWAKSVRRGLSWFDKRRARRETLEQSRRRLLVMEALIPYPPRDIETITINVSGVSADRVITPASRPNRLATSFATSSVFLLGGGAATSDVVLSEVPNVPCNVGYLGCSGRDADIAKATRLSRSGHGRGYLSRD